MCVNLDRRRLLTAIPIAVLAKVVPLRAAPARFAALSRGFNLPDLVPMRAPRTPEGQTLRRLRARGMTHIRLPVRAENLLSRFTDANGRTRTLDDLDRALDRLLAAGYAVSVDMHPDAGLPALYRRDPDAAFEALSEGWRLIAGRLRRRPVERVFAELLNEPPTRDELWRLQAERLVARLRDLLPETTMIVGPAPYQRVEALAQWTPLADANLVYAFHYYDPMAFTHQGETWDPSSPYAQMAGIPFPIDPSDPEIERLRAAVPAGWPAAARRELVQTLSRPWSEATIARAFKPLAAWSRAHSVPVIVNEFGALRFKSRPADRAHWIGAVRRQAERHGFGWAHWEYSHGFGLLDERGRLDPPIIDALLPRTDENGEPD